MAYTVKKRDGELIVVIPDGVIDNTSTSIALLGKGFNNYGEIVAEDWVHMLENFAHSEAPNMPLKGQLWFDKTSNSLKVNIGTRETPNFQELTISGGGADIAERYAASEPLESGDVVGISGSNEIGKTTRAFDPDVFGVISTKPEYKMNVDAGDDVSHPFVALSGRVPCKVKGPVKKGQRIVSSEIPGVACGVSNVVASENILAIIGRSLVDDNRTDERLIEIAVGVK